MLGRDPADPEPAMIARVETDQQSDPAPAAGPSDVVAFWRDAGPDRWFERDDTFDGLCRARFESLWRDARRGALDPWGATPDGALALVLLLDQMPRNMWRSTQDAYATDPDARRIAADAIRRGFDRAVDPELRRFFYLPYMHSEELADQERSVSLNRELGEDEAKWAVHHRDIVARFGRFPHRNAVLGRPSTPEENAFLAGEGAFKG